MLKKELLIYLLWYIPYQKWFINCHFGLKWSSQ